jgi:hypothetical protein
MECNQHELEQDFAGCFICNNCGRIWLPAQPEQYDEYIKSTINYDEDFEKGEENELQV